MLHRENEDGTAAILGLSILFFLLSINTTLVFMMDREKVLADLSWENATLKLVAEEAMERAVFTCQDVELLTNFAPGEVRILERGIKRDISYQVSAEENKGRILLISMTQKKDNSFRLQWLVDIQEGQIQIEVMG